MNPIKRALSALRAGFQKASEVWSTTAGYVSGFFAYASNGKASFSWLSRNGFERNPIANRAILLIAYQVAKVEAKVFYKDAKGKTVEHVNHPALDLLDSPNPRMGRLLFFISIIAYLYLDGNIFIHVMRRKTGSSDAPKGQPLSLWLLRPDRVEFIRDQDQNITGYRYTGKRGNPQDYTLDEVRHIRTFNPRNDEKGYPLLGPAVDALEEMLSATNHNKSLLKAGGRHTGFFVAPQELGGPAFDRLKKELQEAYVEDAQSGKPGLLENGLKFEQNAQTMQELEFIEGDKLSAKKIAATAGIDPALVGDAANKTYANFETAIRALLMLTCLPLLDFIFDELSPFLFEMYPERPRRFFDYNENQIEALQENQTELYSRLTSAAGGAWLSPNEALGEAGFNQKPNPAFDRVYRPFNLLPLESLSGDGELSADERARRKAFFAAIRSLPISEVETILSTMRRDAGGDGQLSKPPVIDE